MTYRIIRTLLLPALLPCMAALAFGQTHYYDVWHFADRLGLDFRSNPPVPRLGSMNAAEGCSSICDPVTGELLFYTDGITVWNREHGTMTNGTGLAGHPSTTQAALIVPDPADEHLFYVFSLDARTSLSQTGYGLTYSVVDIRGAGGRGAVVQKNVPLLATASEKLVGVRHRSGCGYWVITHEVIGDRYYAWAITDKGLQTEPVISAVGERYDIFNRGEPFDAGTIKASADGTMLFASRGRPAARDPYFVDSDSGDVCMFDATTGVVGPVVARLRSRYDASFSPDNRFLYTAVYDSLMQYEVDDLRNGVVDNGVLVAELSGYTRTYWGMQLAPDGKIYLVDAPRFQVPGDPHRLSVIDKPNVRGVGAGVALLPIDFASAPGGGLPNCIDGFLGEANIDVPSDIADPDTVVICAGGSARLVATGGTAYRWRPAQGLSCAGCADPVASPDRSTTYHVTAIGPNGCTTDDSVVIIVLGESETIRLRIGRDHRGAVNRLLVVPVEIVDPIGATDVSELVFTLEYDPNVMLLNDESIGRLLDGTALEGWSMDVIDAARGRLTLRAIAPPGSTLTAKGTLLRFESRVYLSNVPGTELPFTVDITSSCLRFRTSPGYAYVDSICGLNFRLIELTAAKYVAPVAYPNPAPDRISFDFGLGLDGSTQLEVFDALGNRVGLIVDTWLLPGRYSVEWNLRDVPSGVYWYRLTSGDWSRGGQVMVE